MNLERVTWLIRKQAVRLATAAIRTGAFLDESPQEALGAPSVQIAAYFAPPAQAPGAPEWAAARPAGPKIIEIGRHAPRYAHWPVVVYGDR